MANSPTSSEGWKAAVLLGSLGSILVAALALLWIAAFQVVGLRQAASSAIAPEASAAPAPAPPHRAPVVVVTEEPRNPGPEPSTASAPEPAPLAAASATPSSSPSADSASPVEGMAMLKLFSSPPASALLDGKPVGRTPFDATVVPGKHVIIFQDPALGKRTLYVTVKAGETKQLAVSFEAPAQSPY